MVRTLYTTHPIGFTDTATRDFYWEGACSAHVLHEEALLAWHVMKSIILKVSLYFALNPSHLRRLTMDTYSFYLAAYKDNHHLKSKLV